MTLTLGCNGIMCGLGTSFNIRPFHIGLLFYIKYGIMFREEISLVLTFFGISSKNWK